MEPDDIESIGMGQQGCDIVLTPAARKVFPFDVEVKNVEKLNVVGVFASHFKKYQDSPRLKMLIHARNRTETMITLRWSDFLKLFKRNLELERSETKTTDAVNL